MLFLMVSTNQNWQYIFRKFSFCLILTNLKTNCRFNFSVPSRNTESLSEKKFKIDQPFRPSWSSIMVFKTSWSSFFDRIFFGLLLEDWTFNLIPLAQIKMLINLTKLFFQHVSSQSLEQNFWNNGVPVQQNLIWSPSTLLLYHSCTYFVKV